MALFKLKNMSDTALQICLLVIVLGTASVLIIITVLFLKYLNDRKKMKEILNCLMLTALFYGSMTVLYFSVKFFVFRKK